MQSQHFHVHVVVTSVPNHKNKYMSIWNAENAFAFLILSTIWYYVCDAILRSIIIILICMLHRV
jgi:hypothetical protein